VASQIGDEGSGWRNFFVSISQKGNSRCDDRGMCELGGGDHGAVKNWL
jgi:hypothetical protein